MSARRVVVGLGCPDRGDDAAGPVSAQLVAGLALPGVLVVAHEDPTGLADLWRDMDLVVVIDSVRSGAPAGTVTVIEAGEGVGALGDAAWLASGRDGTHAQGLATAVELARVRGGLPARLVLVGVEGAQLEEGAPLSDPVAVALDTVVATVAAVLEGPVARVPTQRTAVSDGRAWGVRGM